MKYYDSSLAEHFGRILGQREAEFRAALDRDDDEKLAATPPDSEVQDFKDLAERESQLDRVARDAARLKIELSQIISARRRLQDGSFGKCVECGKPIDLRRLEALPEAAFCVTCQAADEKAPHPSNGS